ncbi:MAG: hydantoinase/oxoprolinase family protein [Pseudolabrys sp.]
MIEIGVDIGGTFTDVVLMCDNRISHYTKVPSTPGNLIEGVRNGVRRALAAVDLKPGDVDRFVYGSTVAINTLIQQKGAVTGLLASEGFEDTLEIGRHKRSHLYNLLLEPETPAFLAPRRRRFAIPERIAADGSVVVPLDEGAVRKAVEALSAQGATAIAVCYLFSFRNPQHELRTREVIKQMRPDIHVSISSEVDPAFREYERTVMTSLDAYLQGAVGDYVVRQRDDLAEIGIEAKMQVMQSRGGITNPEAVITRPVSLLLSGLAAGVIGSKHVAVESGENNVISLDMGGTSCDIALIRDGVPIVTNQTRVARFPLRMQMVDVNTIGAGGGSIAWVDGGGSLRVGPQSAGAEPGPACYRRGGSDATVTDANLVLGYLNPHTFAGGISLDLEAAKAAIKVVADKIGLDLVATAAGIHRIVNARMNDEVRRVSVQRGFDPRQFALLPLGGAGPVHGCALAKDLNITKVLIPDTPGVLSAFGLLVANIEHDQMETLARRADQLDRTSLESVFGRLDAAGQAKMAADGVAPQEVEIRRQADIRYVGQSYELTVDMDAGASDPIAEAAAAFHARHDALYGHKNTQAPVEFVNLRTVHVHRPEKRENSAAPARNAGAPVPVAHRDAYFDDDFVKTSVYDRKALSAGQTVEGPAIVEQSDTTLIIHPGQRAHIRADRSILVDIRHA